MTLCALQICGIDVAPLLALGGAGSIIIGLATQQVLANAVSGINIVSRVEAGKPVSATLQLVSLGLLSLPA